MLSSLAQPCERGGSVPLAKKKKKDPRGGGGGGDWQLGQKKMIASGNSVEMNEKAGGKVRFQGRGDRMKSRGQTRGGSAGVDYTVGRKEGSSSCTSSKMGNRQGPGGN